MFVAYIFMFLSAHALENCSNGKPQKLPEYHLVERCHRSKLSIAAKANFATASDCERFALEKRAMSFNFSPREMSREQPLEYTCEALQCAETSARITLSNDVRYDYYSIYHNPLPSTNSTCVPALGVFYFLNKKINYTQAISMCHNRSSILADVISAQRTEALAQLLSNMNTESAYVNLKRSNSSGFVATNGDALECISYRAWDPGHPRRQSKADCVVVTKHQTWRSVPCDRRQAAICELTPDKPHRKRYFTYN